MQFLNKQLDESKQEFLASPNFPPAKRKIVVKKKKKKGQKALNS